ncbi:MAG: PrgI family protein [Candidatus Uhrbacteria bacterium]
MPDKFVVPQFIDVEDKIIGPMSARQFVLMIFPLIFGAICYKIFDLALFLLTGVPVLMIFAVLAFLKVNGMPLHFFLLNLLQSFKKPRLRVWDKAFITEEIKARLHVAKIPPLPPPPRKDPISRSRLHELTLVVNTGGVYQSDEE